jgi:hypothetical protein
MSNTWKSCPGVEAASMGAHAETYEILELSVGSTVLLRVTAGGRVDFGSMHMAVTYPDIGSGRRNRGQGSQ